MFFEQITTPGLGCYSYAIGCPTAGQMVVVDPRRDVGVYLNIAREHEMRITHIFDTHVHADHVSGAQELRALTGADICIHESAPVRYQAKKLRDGDAFSFGNVAIRVVHTPGHTPDSISLLISELARSASPARILTGDLLFVGDIGRPDLPGDQILDTQIKNLYDSLHHTLQPLPDYLEVYPAHGEGSLCGQGMSAKPFSTLGYERVANPMLLHPDFVSFKHAILSNLPMRPQSFSGIIKQNMEGAAIPPKRELAVYALSPEQICAVQNAGAVILDLRDALSYGAAHIPGSINVDFSSGPRLNWVGVAIPPGVPIALVLSSDEAFGDMCLELRRIGYDDVKGWLKGGFQAWLESGNETEGLPWLSATALRARIAAGSPPALIDVRTPREYGAGHIDGAVHLPFDRIMEAVTCPVSATEETVVVCQGGFRAGIAASMLQARGCRKLAVLSGGMDAWENT